MITEKTVLQLISGIRVNEKRTERAGRAVYGILKLLDGDPLVGPTTRQRERFAHSWGRNLMLDYQKLLRREVERNEAAIIVFEDYYERIKLAISTPASP